jgi:hypothetical protein
VGDHLILGLEGLDCGDRAENLLGNETADLIKLLGDTLQIL